MVIYSDVVDDLYCMGFKKLIFVFSDDSSERQFNQNMIIARLTNPDKRIYLHNNGAKYILQANHIKNRWSTYVMCGVTGYILIPGWHTHNILDDAFHAASIQLSQQYPDVQPLPGNQTDGHT